LSSSSIVHLISSVGGIRWFLLRLMTAFDFNGGEDSENSENSEDGSVFAACDGGCVTGIVRGDAAMARSAASLSSKIT